MKRYIKSSYDADADYTYIISDKYKGQGCTGPSARYSTEPDEYEAGLYVYNLDPKFFNDYVYEFFAFEQDYRVPRSVVHIMLLPIKGKSGKKEFRCEIPNAGSLDEAFEKVRNDAMYYLMGAANEYDQKVAEKEAKKADRANRGVMMAPNVQSYIKKRVKAELGIVPIDTNSEYHISGGRYPSSTSNLYYDLSSDDFNGVAILESIVEELNQAAYVIYPSKYDVVSIEDDETDGILIHVWDNSYGVEYNKQTLAVVALVESYNK